MLDLGANALGVITSTWLAQGRGTPGPTFRPSFTTYPIVTCTVLLVLIGITPSSRQPPGPIPMPWKNAERPMIAASQPTGIVRFGPGTGRARVEFPPPWGGGSARAAMASRHVPCPARGPGRTGDQCPADFSLPAMSSPHPHGRTASGPENQGATG